MYDRRRILGGLWAGGATILLAGCGGGSGATSVGSPEPIDGAPDTPAPSPTPTPPPVVTQTVKPTLRGVTIDDAEAEIREPVDAYADWFAKIPAPQNDILVSNADELNTVLQGVFSTGDNAQTLAINHRIQCAWNGDSMLSAGLTGRVVVLGKLLSDSFYDHGGSLVIEPAPGYKPALANTVYVGARGVVFRNLTFSRAAGPTEKPDSLSAAIIYKSGTFPVDSIVQFENCLFGVAKPSAASDTKAWVNGLSTMGQSADYVGLVGCTLQGVQNGMKIIAKALKVDGCDLRQCLQDGISLLGHRFGGGYYAHAAITRTTFRDWASYWENRSEHSDAIQTGTASDQHLGYRLLVSDVMIHMARSYAGAEGAGGGTQGFYNDDFLNADNQFVVRRTICLVTSPNGFTYFSPKASRPSFVDQSVFMRSGTVPSAFAPDTVNHDMTVTVRDVYQPASEQWLLVSNTVAKANLSDQTKVNDMVEVDARVPGRAPDEQFPEKLFAGRDFGRANAAVNYQAGKFGYSLPNEARSRKAFVEDVWANFAPVDPKAAFGAPDPRSINWAG